jgi:hypothetical protein
LIKGRVKGRAMAKKRDAAVNALPALIARFGVTGVAANPAAANKAAVSTPPRDIPDSESLIPGAIAIRVSAKECPTDADLFREVARSILYWAGVFGYSKYRMQKSSEAKATEQSRESEKMAHKLVVAAQDAVILSGRPTAAEWIMLVEAAIHAGSASSMLIEYVSGRNKRAQGSRRKAKEDSDKLRSDIRAAAEKLPLKMYKSDAAEHIRKLVHKSHGRVARILGELYPGDSWKKRVIT